MLINHVINYLQNRKLLNLALVFGYGIALILFHDTVVQVSIKVMNSLSLDTYNQVVKWICIGVGLVVTALLIRALAKSRENKVAIISYLLVSLGLAIAHFFVMLEMNIEMIHALEFTILAVLIFPLVGRFGAAIVFCLPFIFVNEWYQYQVLYPGYIKYFEFNDIFIDLIGCGVAIIVLWINGVKPKTPVPAYWRRPELLFIICTIGLCLNLVNACFFAQYTSTQCENTWLVLNLLDNPHQFWQHHDFTGAVYHVMNPKEGMVALSLLCLFYMSMDDAAYTK